MRFLFFLFLIFGSFFLVSILFAFLSAVLSLPNSILSIGLIFVQSLVSFFLGVRFKR